MNEAVPQENENIEYIHVFITNDLLGKINFDNSCFDTESIYSNDYQIVGLNNDDKEINNEVISTKNNKIDNYESERPLIVDELIDQFFEIIEKLHLLLIHSFYLFLEVIL